MSYPYSPHYELVFNLVTHQFGWCNVFTHLVSNWYPSEEEAHKHRP